jgi:hypothetical protein
VLRVALLGGANARGIRARKSIITAHVPHALPGFGGGVCYQWNTRNPNLSMTWLLWSVLPCCCCVRCRCPKPASTEMVALTMHAVPGEHTMATSTFPNAGSMVQVPQTLHRLNRYTPTCFVLRARFHFVLAPLRGEGDTMLTMDNAAHPLIPIFTALEAT